MNQLTETRLKDECEMIEKHIINKINKKTNPPCLQCQTLQTGGLGDICTNPASRNAQHSEQNPRFSFK